MPDAKNQKQGRFRGRHDVGTSGRAKTVLPGNSTAAHVRNAVQPPGGHQLPPVSRLDTNRGRALTARDDQSKTAARRTWSITAAAGAQTSAASWIKIRAGDPGRRQIEPPGAPIQTRKRVRGGSCPRQFVASCLSGVQNLDAGSSSEIRTGTMVESAHRATTGRALPNGSATSF